MSNTISSIYLKQNNLSFGRKIQNSAREKQEQPTTVPANHSMTKHAADALKLLALATVISSLTPSCSKEVNQPENINKEQQVELTQASQEVTQPENINTEQNFELEQVPPQEILSKIEIVSEKILSNDKNVQEEIKRITDILTCEFLSQDDKISRIEDKLRKTNTIFGYAYKKCEPNKSVDPLDFYFRWLPIIIIVAAFASPAIVVLDKQSYASVHEIPYSGEKFKLWMLACASVPFIPNPAHIIDNHYSKTFSSALVQICEQAQKENPEFYPRLKKVTNDYLFAQEQRENDKQKQINDENVTNALKILKKIN